MRLRTPQNLTLRAARADAQGFGGHRGGGSLIGQRNQSPGPSSLAPPSVLE